jgi:hypothetical protein
LISFRKGKPPGADGDGVFGADELLFVKDGGGIGGGGAAEFGNNGGGEGAGGACGTEVFGSGGA